MKFHTRLDWFFRFAPMTQKERQEVQFSQSKKWYGFCFVFVFFVRSLYFACLWKWLGSKAMIGSQSQISHCLYTVFKCTESRAEAEATAAALAATGSSHSTNIFISANEFQLSAIAWNFIVPLVEIASLKV